MMYETLILQIVDRVHARIRQGVPLEEAIRRLAKKLKLPTTHIFFENARNQFSTRH